VSLDRDLGIWDAVARSDKDGQVTVAVVNITDKTYQVHKGDVIGSFRNLEQSGEELVPLNDKVEASIFRKIGKDPKEPERGQTESIDPKQAKELEARLQIHATGSIRTRYRELIMQYHDVISKDKYDLGRAPVIKHKIKMREGQPLHARQFRIPFAHEETIFETGRHRGQQVAIQLADLLRVKEEVAERVEGGPGAPKGHARLQGGECQVHAGQVQHQGGQGVY
jgi:hypothetical protein